MKAFTTRERLLASTMIGGAMLALAAVPAAAQDQPTQVGEIVITGSRIVQPNLVTTSPVTQVTGEDIRSQGVTRVEDLVTQLPQAFAAQNSTVANGASGTATVSLRNLGSTRTLVLIDGRRMGYGSPNDAAADLNQIPGQLVDRVEVLTGGASAVYGSDAVAGVVNFITKRNVEGIQIDAQYGFYHHRNDYDGPGNLRNVIAGRAATNPSQFRLPENSVMTGFSREVTALLGINAPDGRGNLTAYAGYRRNNKVLQRDYDYSSCALGAPTATEFTCGGSGTSFPGLFTDFSSYNLTLGAAPGTWQNYNAAVNAYNFGPLNYYQRPDERYVFGASGYYTLNPNVEVFTQLMFSDYSSVAQIAPSGIFANTDSINCGNPLLSTAQKTQIGCTAADIAADNSVPFFILRRNVEGGGRQDDLRYQTYRGVIGLRGEMGPGWDYDLALQYSRVQLSRTYLNDFSVTRAARAIDVVNVGGVPTCRSVVNGTDPACVPYNIFGFVPGGVTQAALDYLQIPLIQSGYTTQQVGTLAFTGDLGQYGWQSPMASRGVQVAFGIEFRRDALGSTTDASFASGDGAGQGGPTIGFSGAISNQDVFFEAQIPLAEGQPGMHWASVDLAYRHSNYSTGITADAYKFGADWAPVPDIRFRGSFQRAVRAPNVIELFTAQGFNLFDMDEDPCGPAQTATLAQCVATGVPAPQYGSAALDSPAGQYNFLQGGFIGLEPEESDTFTLGFVFTPSFLPRFVLSVDYYDIEVTNLISTFGSENTINECYFNSDAAACSRINRNALGQLWIGDGFVEDLNTNIGGLSTSGVDISASYGLDLADFGMDGFGGLNFNFVGTWLESLVTDTGTGLVYDCVGQFVSSCGTPNPEWRHRARIGWSTPWDGIELAATWRHYSSVTMFGGNPARLDYEFPAINYLDLSGSWQIRDNMRLRAGVNNVLDRDPPLNASVGTTGNGNTYPQTYDSMGRFIFIGITADF